MYTWGCCHALCQVHGSMGAVYPVRHLFPGSPAPSQTQGDTSRDNHTSRGQLSSFGVSSHSNYGSLPVCTGLGAPCTGALICTAWGCPEAGDSSLSCVLPTSVCPGAIAGCWAVSLGTLGSEAYTPGIVLPGHGSRRQQGTASSAWSPHLTPSFNPRPCRGLQPFTEISRGVWGALPLAHLLC